MIINLSLYAVEFKAPLDMRFGDLVFDFFYLAFGKKNFKKWKIYSGATAYYCRS